MAVKPDAQPCIILEQIFEDRASGITFQFEMMPDGEPRLRVFGVVLPFGNREYFFDESGRKTGAGTTISGLCRPAWLEQVD